MMELKKRRNAYLMFLLLCLVAAAAIAGMSALLYQSSTSEQDVAKKSENAQSENGSQPAEGEDIDNGSGTAGGSADSGAGSGAGETADGAAGSDSGALTADGSEIGAESRNTADSGESKDAEGTGGGNASNVADAGGVGENGEDTLAAAGQVSEALLAEKVAAYSFEAARITWPVEGEICLEYNMEHTVYYSTLDLYRCSPGVCISSAVGTAVLAGAEGVVTSVTEDPFYGNLVTVALGDGYEATYGQLADVSVATGDEVSASMQIGTVAEPTIYFTEEGAHLFFEVTKDGETVDPLDYLNY